MVFPADLRKFMREGAINPRYVNPCMIVISDGIPLWYFEIFLVFLTINLL